MDSTTFKRYELVIYYKLEGIVAVAVVLIAILNKWLRHNPHFILLTNTGRTF